MILIDTEQQKEKASRERRKAKEMTGYMYYVGTRTQ